AEHGEILREHEGLAPADGAMAGHHSVAEDLLLLHAEVGATMGDELVELDEAARIEQQLDALARGQLASGVLLGDALFPAAQERARFHLFQSLQRIHYAMPSLS